MIILTVQFNYPKRPDYKLLLDVFRESVKRNMPQLKCVQIPIEKLKETAKTLKDCFAEVRIKPPQKLLNRPLNFKYNDVKLKIWRDFVNNTSENVILADCDMLMIKSADHAFNVPFDIAYTARTVLKRIPMNGGIMMVRPTEKSRLFFQKMYEINHKMLHDSSFHHPYRCRWAGMNQSAFGWMMENGCCGAKVHKYITREWNAVDCDWKFINNKTVFVHYKSKLRKLVLRCIPRQSPLLKGYSQAQKLWYQYYELMIKRRKKKK